MGLMFRRRRPLARLAVGAATAGVAYHAGKRRAQQDEYNEEASAAYADAQSQLPPPQYVAPAPASTGDEVDELSRLAQMHDSGALSDDKFAAAKAQLLGTRRAGGERRTTWLRPLPPRRASCGACSRLLSPATVTRWPTS
jgi:hypothetical protein